jgi:hypothetical protein
MSRRLSTALLFATAIPLLPLHADAGVKSGASLHPVIAPTMHPMPRHKTVHGFGKFPRHHHHRRFFDWGLPITSGADAFYGSDYDPADEPGEVGVELARADARHRHPLLRPNSGNASAEIAEFSRQFLRSARATRELGTAHGRRTNSAQRREAIEELRPPGVHPFGWTQVRPPD